METDTCFDFRQSWYASKEHPTLMPPSLYLTYPPNSCIVDRQVAGQIGSSINRASNKVTSDATIVSNAVVDFHAGNCIELQAGFEVQLGGEFDAYILGCLSDVTSDEEEEK